MPSWRQQARAIGKEAPETEPQPNTSVRLTVNEIEELMDHNVPFEILPDGTIKIHRGKLS